MKKHPLDKTKQQFKLGERVFAAARRGRADCVAEGGICGVSKQAAETGISGRLQNQVRTSPFNLLRTLAKGGRTWTYAGLLFGRRGRRRRPLQ